MIWQGLFNQFKVLSPGKLSTVGPRAVECAADKVENFPEADTGPRWDGGMGARGERENSDRERARATGPK
jgi:hypothetical protein